MGNWAKPIIVRGSRRQFEMEQVLPGPGRFIFRPITEYNDRKDGGDTESANEAIVAVRSSDSVSGRVRSASMPRDEHHQLSDVRG